MFKMIRIVGFFSGNRIGVIIGVGGRWIWGGD